MANIVQSVGDFTMDFADFVYIMEKQDPACTLEMPDVHFEMCEWIQWATENNDPRILGLAPRHIAKSMIWGTLLPLWFLMRDPSDELLIMSAHHDLAAKNAMAIKSIIENVDDIGHILKPRKRQGKWGAYSFDVRGHNPHSQNRSVECRSILGKRTGFHANKLFMDDVEIKENVVNPENREKIISFFEETQSIVDKWQFAWGTYHCADSSYLDLQAAGFRTQKWQIYERRDGEAPTGKELENEIKLIWPERFPYELLDRIRKGVNQKRPEESGIAWFMSQYLNIATSAWQSTLAVDNLEAYEGEPEWKTPVNKPRSYPNLMLGDEKIIQCIASWDTAEGKEGGDSSVLAIAMKSEENKYYVHKLIELPRTSKASLDKGEIGGFTPQAKKIIMACQENYVSSLYVEENYSKHMESFLVAAALEMRNKGMEVTLPRVVGYKESGKKEVRIANAFAPILDGARLFVHKQVLEMDATDAPRSKFWRYINEHPKYSKSPDELDAAAKAIKELVGDFVDYDGITQNAHPGTYAHSEGYRINTVQNERSGERGIDASREVVYERDLF